MATVEQSIEVNASPLTVYERLSRFDDYPRFMQDVRQVRRIGSLQLQWQTGHGERARSWEAEITQQIPGRRLAWRHLHGPRYEASVELEPLDGDARTRVTLRIECDPHEQILAEHGDAQQALRRRTEQDLARFKKHVEGHDPAGVHVRVASAGAGADADAGIGKTVAQTAAERAESAASAGSGNTRHAGRTGTSARGWRTSAVPASEQQDGDAPRHGAPWLRVTPTLPDLWNLWQQPWRLMRRVSHDVERIVDTVRARGQQEGQTAASAWTPAVETAQREDRFVVCAELPGVRCEQLRVEIKHDRLTIEGDRQPDVPPAADERRHSERCYGHFYRVIALPPGAQPEDASAQMHDGVLEITVPLAAYAIHPRRLEVRQT